MTQPARLSENSHAFSTPCAALPRLRPRLAAALLAGTAVCATLPAFAAGITEIGGAGDRSAIAWGVSGDGTIVVGYRSDGATNTGFRWTEAGGFSSVGTLGGDTIAYGISRDGSTIVGDSQDGNGSSRAFRWTQAGGIQSLGTLGGVYSRAYGVNADGSVVVGLSKDLFDNVMAFRWRAGVMTSLGGLNGGNSSAAQGVSGDGTIVIGYAQDGGVNQRRGFYWTQGRGMQSLGVLPGDTSSAAYGISADGSTIVGSSTGAASQAFRWTMTDKMVSLGMLNGGTSGEARAVNADGSVIVGYAADGANGNVSRAFRWTQSTGMITVEQWLRNYGVSIPTDSTGAAYGVSADGNVVVGTGANSHGFIARAPVQVPGGTTKAGLMDVDNYQQSLAALAGLLPLSLNADMVINGAHSSPLFMLLDAGQSSAWFTGDGGYADARTFNGGLGAWEIGFGRGLEGGWTVRLSGGGQYSRFDLNNGGNATFSGGYVAPEVAYSFDDRFVGTLTGYYSAGKADIRRGYLNGSANDFSSGSTNTQTFALRARLDWKNAFTVADTGVSPYVSYTYINAQMNGYTETGGSFPARINGVREISNAIRIGADARTPLNDQLALVTRFEYGHRFEKAGAGVTGQILGLSAFSIDGASVQQDWIRGGIGISYKLGQGDGLVMVNTSNQTGRNATWVSASYRVKF